MEYTKQKFDEIKKLKNPDLINDFIIKLSEEPKKEYLIYLKDLIKNLDIQILNKVCLNLIFVLGEIGKSNSIDEYHMNFLYETYHRSDRWIRNEIIQTIEKISNKSKLNEKIIYLIGNALRDDYDFIQFNALKVLLNLESFPDSIFKNIFHLLNLKNSSIIESCRHILDKIQLNHQQLFNLLNQSENYKILKQRGIRSLLLIQFKSIINLESFRDKILNSDWNEKYKENYLKELDTFQRILAKNI
ncbi:MAG: hypothetical protein ACFFA0_15770 [Promethearchaeota archaeon]